MLASDLVVQIVQKYAARERKLSSLAFVYRFLSRAGWVNPLVRLMNKLPLGFRLAFSRYESTVYAYSSAQDNALYQGFDGLMLNIGSGAFTHPRWRNYDYPGQSAYYKKLLGKPGKDFHPIDLTKDLPLDLPDGSVSLIYCSHTIEHLPERVSAQLLKECARLLKTGGCLRLAIPDMKSDYLRAKVVASQELDDVESLVAACFHSFSPSAQFEIDQLRGFAQKHDYDAEKVAAELRNNDMLKGEFRPDHPEYHLSFWSHEKLARMASESGFSTYMPRRRGESAFMPFTNTCVFDTTEPQCSLYGELIKS
jgi:SAM-dependent methyltransferase